MILLDNLMKSVFLIVLLFISSYANTSDKVCHDLKYNSPKFYEISGEACFDLGIYYLNNKKIIENEKKAFKAFSKGCDKNNARSCHELGNFYIKGKVIPKNITKAMEYNIYSCQGSYMKACRTIRILQNQK